MTPSRLNFSISSAWLLRAVCLLAIPAFACAESSPVTLKDAYREHFKVGTAINRAIATGQAFRRGEEQVKADVSLVKAQFNQVVAENDMKWERIHPRPGADG